jgi:hypothetical protein
MSQIRVTIVPKQYADRPVLRDADVWDLETDVGDKFTLHDECVRVQWADLKTNEIHTWIYPLHTVETVQVVESTGRVET